MKALILKDLYNDKAILAIGLLMILLLLFVINTINALMISLILGILLIFITCGSVIYIESYEEKYRGYRLLAIMPLKTSQVLLSKTCFIGFTIIVNVSIALVLVTTKLYSTHIYTYIKSVILIAGDLSFVIAGLMYLFIFLAGSKKTNKVVKSAIPIATIGILVLLFLTKNNGLTIDYVAIDNMILKINWAIISFVCIIFFIITMLVSSLFKKGVY